MFTLKMQNNLLSGLVNVFFYLFNSFEFNHYFIQKLGLFLQKRIIRTSEHKQIFNNLWFIINIIMMIQWYSQTKYDEMTQIIEFILSLPSDMSGVKKNATGGTIFLQLHFSLSAAPIFQFISC